MNNESPLVRELYVILFAVLMLIVAHKVPVLAETSISTGGSQETNFYPSDPANFSGYMGSCGTGKIYLTWQASNNAFYYHIYRDGNTLIYGGNGLSAEDSGLVPGSSHSYTAKAFNTYGSSPGITISVSAPPQCFDNNSTGSVPAKTVLFATMGACGSGTVELFWEASLGAIGYKLYRNDLPIYYGENLFFKDTGLAPGTSLNYSIFPYNSNNIGEKTYLSFSSPPLCEGNTTNTATPTPTPTSFPTPTQSQTPAITSTPIPTPTPTSAQSPTSTPMPAATPIPTITPIPIPTPTPIPTAKTISTPVISPTPEPARAESLTTANTPVAENIKDISEIIDAAQRTVDEARSELIKIVDESISKQELSAEREKLVTKIEETLSNFNEISPGLIDELGTEIGMKLKELNAPNEDIKNVSAVLKDLGADAETNLGELKREGGELLFKDTNGDGIFDYESAKIYGIDPKKPSPVTEFEGKKLTASEKLLMGYNPAKKELVKIEYEEPLTSFAPVIPNYKVKDVGLSEEKKVFIKGRALPNSFVTVYIYSTPIIVTVKTDSNGEWQYVLDKELSTGEHTVYTATVDNSGKIVARSPGYVFSKTAEAASLGPIPQVEVGLVKDKPGLLKEKNLMFILAIISAAGIISLIIIGVRGPNRE